jgi:hypothetical protein
MELFTNLVRRQEPIYKADIAKLAKALADPASVHSSKNQNGYVCLSGEKASWDMCARVAYNALKGRNHAKATSFVYQVGIEVIEIHGWQDREPPKVIKQKVIELESKGKKKKKIKAVWLDGIDRRPKQLHEQCVGSYCLTIMILLGYCRLEWSEHKDYKCWVVLLPDGHPISKEPSTYTKFRPFEPWWQHTDEYRHKLVKTDLGTNWKPKGWHFTGQPPSPDEDRFWHPYQDHWRRVVNPKHPDYERPESPESSDQPQSPISWAATGMKISEEYTSLKQVQERPVYKATTWPAEWVTAVNKHEAVPYRINKEMLDLIQQLGIVDESRPESVSFLDEANRLAAHEKFYQRMHLDFRGRLYTSRSLVNYQGDDKYRCLIEFADGVELDNPGFQALLFHATNLWELPNDLLPRGDMPKYWKLAQVGLWQLKEFVAFAEDPVGTYDDWIVNSVTGEKLDDPLLFIRACMELRDATTKKRMLPKKGFITHLPVEVDQTNSVIQHIALFYGDRALAEMCSLVAESDFYSQIAESWDIAGLTDVQKRKITKKIVVPRCYGSGSERIAKEELSNIPFLKDWVLEGESDSSDDPTEQDAVDAASQVYSKESAVKKVKELKDDVNLQWSYSDIIHHMQLVALAEEGIRRVEQAVPAIETYRDEMKDVIKDWGCPIDGEMAWATMSGFEVHFRPVYVDKMRFRVPKSKEERDVRVQLSARHVTPRLNETDVKLGLQANLVHSVDATLAHMIVARAGFPVIAVHDAFAAHANNIDDLRIDFAYNLIGVHMVGKPLRNFRSDVLGEPRPEGGLAWDEESAGTIAILREIEGRGFLEMTG